jgi:hypothetical protein
LEENVISFSQEYCQYKILPIIKFAVTAETEIGPLNLESLASAMVSVLFQIKHNVDVQMYQNQVISIFLCLFEYQDQDV